MQSQSTNADVNDRMTDLIETHKPAVTRFVRQFTQGCYYVTEDVVQETMVRAWRHLDRLPSDEGGLRRWLFTVAHRLSIDAARRQKTNRAEPTIYLDNLSGTTSDEVSSTVMASDALRQGLQALAAPQRQVLEEIYVHHRTAQEAAERLRIPLGTVRSRQHYAIRALRSAVLA